MSLPITIIITYHCIKNMFAPRSIYIAQKPLLQLCLLPVVLMLIMQDVLSGFAWGCLIVLVAQSIAQAALVYGAKWLPRQPLGVLILSEACKWSVFSLSIYMVISYKLQGLTFIMGIIMGQFLVFGNLFYYGKCS